jgi:hypothetical protein
MVKGQRIKVPQWIEGTGRGGPFVVRIDADAIIPDEDQSEPCFEPATLRWLEQMQLLADQGQVDELAKHGTVYVRRAG